MGHSSAVRHASELERAECVSARSGGAALACGAERAECERVRAGDREAMNALYRRHRQAILHHAWRMLKDEAAAQDVVQETFARAMVAAEQTRPGLNFRAWVFRIATNLCLRELDRRGRQRLDPDLDTSRGTTPHDPAGQRELAEQLDAALSRLPHRYRQILLLRELEQLSYDELAAVLELSESNVKVLLHRARARFTALFVADRLLQAGSAPAGCDELVGRLRAGSRHEIEQHLEQCPTCRQLERRDVAQLLALLPAPPPMPLPRAQRGPSSGAASAETTTTFSIVIAVAVAASVLLAATVLGVAQLRRQRVDRPVSHSRAAPPVRGAAPTPTVRPTTPTVRSTTPPPARAPERTVMSDAGKTSTRARRVNRRIKRRPPRVVPQAIDQEAPPRPLRH